MMLSDVCLTTSVAYIRSTGSVCGRPDGMARIGSLSLAPLGRPGSRLPLRASVAGAGHIVAASRTAYLGRNAAADAQVGLRNTDVTWMVECS